MDVVVTGLGVVSPLGRELAGVWSRAVQGKSGVTLQESDHHAVAAIARSSFDPEPWFSKLQLVGVDRVSQMAVASADLALNDAGGTSEVLGPDRSNAAVYWGCGMGGANALDTAYRAGARVPPLTIPAFMANAPAGHISMRLGITGPVLTYSVACASSAAAIAEGAKAIQRSDVDVAVVGGSEALLVPGVIKAWQAMQTLALVKDGDAAAACKPFSSDRTGFALGEGAAALVLESGDRARARGARIYARLGGWGMSADASHLTKPDSGGQVLSIIRALKQAGVNPSDVAYVNAHGTATAVGDPIEAQAINQVWGDALEHTRISSTKAIHGHLLGAAGALEALITVLAIHHSQRPLQANTATAAPDCPVPLVSAADVDTPQMRWAASTSFAFGGTNVALIFGKP
jgi:3-oxoacyl-[acyl-carrier-protein] synthase II